MGRHINRRSMLAGMAAASAVAATSEALDLKPGEFQWHPDLAPEGPVAVIVSLPEQRVHVYRNGVQIGLSTCSTGKPGHSTPTGTFTVLQKDAHHHSSTYDNAPMPNMNRLTWSGIALHAGNLPGYPASHGCVRLPLEFSKLLFGVTHVGTPVIIADAHNQPMEVVHPGPMLSAIADDELEAAVAKVAEKGLPPQERSDAMQQPMSVLVSRADREIYILRDGNIVAKGSVDVIGSAPLGSHVFMLVAAHDDKRSLRWTAVGFRPANAQVEVVSSGPAILDRLKPDVAIAQQIRAAMHPGLVLVLTDLPAHPDTRTARDFVVMTQDDAT